MKLNSAKKIAKDNSKNRSIILSGVIKSSTGYLVVTCIESVQYRMQRDELIFLYIMGKKLKLKK